MLSNFELAKRLARIAHEGQVDKAGNPYFQHVSRVSGMMPTYYDATVAILHDIVEDTAVTLPDIEAIFGEQTARDVDALTRRKDRGESYSDYIDRVIASPGRTAKWVKLGDIKDHLADTSHISDSLVSRYEAARERIEEALGIPVSRKS